MKKLVITLALVFTFGITGSVNASLWDRGGGLIYDDVLDITWLQDANYAYSSGYDSDGEMNWYQATAWADQLVYGGYDDWRLPQTLPVNGSSYNYNLSYNGGTDIAYNISDSLSVHPGSTGSEMAYMFYCNLGLIGMYTVNGDGPRLNEMGVKSMGPFNNLISDTYWSGTEFSGNYAWMFAFHPGKQQDHYKSYEHYAWAVRDGDSSPVPIPSAVWLLGSAFIGLVGFRKKFRKA